MGEDASVTCETRMEDLELKQLRVYTCKNNNVDVPADKAIFIFKRLDMIYEGQPSQSTETISQPPPTWLLFPYAGDCDRIAGVADAAANLFECNNSVQDLAREIVMNIDSFYGRDDRYTEGRDYSLVFVVEVWRVCASKVFVEAKQKLVLDDTSHDILDVRDNDKTIDVEKVIELLKLWQQGYVSDCDAPSVEEVEPWVTIEDMKWYRIGNDYYVVSRDDDEQPDVCSICLDSMSRKVRNKSVFTWLPECHSLSIAWLGCNHAFHCHCILEWLHRKSSCPCCRSYCSLLL